MNGWIPRKMCIGSNHADLIAAIFTAQVSLAVAYFFIGGLLLWASRQPMGRIADRLKPMFVLFGFFIVACGVTHLVEAVVLFWPRYYILGGVLVGAATISVLTAVVVVISRKEIKQFLMMR